MVAGAVVKLTAVLEAVLVAQGIATTSSAALTTGNQVQNLRSGVVSFAPSASSVVVTNSLVNANSKIFAVIEQAAADGSLVYIARIVPAAGSFTIYGNTTATAALPVSWQILSD